MRIVAKIMIACAFVFATNYVLSERHVRNTIERSPMDVLDEAASRYGQPINTLFIGDSHIGRSIDPRMFGKNAFSLWAPGQCFVRSYYRLGSFLEDSEHPLDLVVLSVDAHSFRESYLEGLTAYPWSKYIRFQEVRSLFDLPFGFVWKSARQSLMPYAGQFEENFISVAEDMSMPDVISLQGMLPYHNNPTPQFRDEPDALARLDAQFRLGPEPISQGYAVYLERTIELARERGANVVLITTPVTRLYWEQVPDYISLDDFYDRIRELDEVAHLDYHDLYFDRPELFWDADHLNRDGSQLFTQRLQADLARLTAGSR